MCAKKIGTIEDLSVVGIDIGKETFHLVGFDRNMIEGAIRRFQELSETNWQNPAPFLAIICRSRRRQKLWQPLRPICRLAEQIRRR